MAVIIIRSRIENNQPENDNVFWETNSGKRSHRLSPGETLVLPEFAATSGLYTKARSGDEISVEYAAEAPVKK